MQLGWLVAVMLAATPLAAQDAVPTVPSASVLIVDSDQLFISSQYGQAILAALEAEADALRLENDRLVAELVSEERALTQQRATMEDAAFRAAAAAFDTKAQAIRQEREAASDALVAKRTTERNAFFDRIHPIIGELMLARGASVVLDRRSVFLADRTADITAEAVALINAKIGDGSGVDDTATPDSPSDP